MASEMCSTQLSLLRKAAAKKPRAPLHLLKQPFADVVVGANGFPMLLRKRVEGQAGFEIALQTGNSRWINLLVFFDESLDRLIRFLPAFLIKYGLQFWFPLVSLLGCCDISQHVVYLMDE